MGRRKRSRQPAKTEVSPRRRIRYPIRPFWVLVAVLVVLVLMFGRPVLTWYARQLAARQLHAGAVSAAQQWLTWAAWFDPEDGRTDLLQAACLRRWQQVDSFVLALESAARKGVPAAQIEQQRQLGLVQAGRLDRRPDLQMHAMLEAGLPPHEVAAAFVLGFLVCDQPEEATKLLDAWASDGRTNAEIAYLRGIVWQWLEKSPRAREQWEAALVIEPRHEQARLSLAELYEQQDRVREAWTHYAELARRSPRSNQARVGMARLLRKTGRLSAARTVLESAPFKPTLTELWAAEMGQIEFESDRFEQAIEWFREAGLDASEDGPLLRAAAMTFALTHQTFDAEQLLARADAAAARPRRINELRTRLAFAPDDQQAEEELDGLLATLFTPGARPESLASGRSDRAIERSRAAGVSELYIRHCAACHGDRGHGDGRAAQHLFPRPPSLRDERFRLASTVNGVATIDDLVAVIGRGVPGTSMASIDGLTQAEQRQLAEEVWQMHREGVRQRLIAAMQDAYEDEEIDEDEIDQLVQLHTQPGEAVRVPQIGVADAESVARGKEAYFQLGCEKCHGDDGTGAADNPLFDERGLPALPRDLVHEPLKGGHEPQAIYLRLYVGMPGTHHPNSSAVPEDQLVDLVQNCRQLARQPQRTSTNYQRFHRAKTNHLESDVAVGTRGD